MATSFTSPTLSIAHDGLVCGCPSMETCFMKLPTNSTGAAVASSDSLELGSKCCNRGYTTFMHSCYVSLCGLPLCGWAVVALRHFHFSITALTIDWGSSSSAKKLTNWVVGKVASYDCAMLKVTELFSKAILLPMFVYGDCMAVCSILYSWQRVAEIDSAISATPVADRCIKFEHTAMQSP